MSKKNVRLLASGFLFSGLLLLALSTFAPAETGATNQDIPDELEAEIRYLEDTVVTLELENEQLSSENTRLAQENETDSTSDSEETEEFDTLEEAEETDSEEETEEAAEEEVEPSVMEYVVVVNEGEPSSVVASQLESFGLIDDFHGFNRYMEENNLFRRLRPGRYTVQSDMNREQLIEAIVR